MIARSASLRAGMAASVTSVTLFCAAFATADSIRIATWNITSYSGGQTSDVQTAVYGEFSGRCLCPDIFVTQEFTSAAAVTSFRNILNAAPGSPGDWAAAPFVDGPDTDSAFFYRTSVVSLVTDLSPNGVTVVSVGSPGDTTHPRNIMRYDVRPLGHVSPESTLAIYSTHMKAGSSGTDMDRRLDEAVKIRNDAENLPAGWNFILGGDFNIRSSSEGAYVELTGSQANNAGRFFDPISTPGTWWNNFGFRFVHTQDPATTMDDRFDQILVSASLVNGVEFQYDGVFGVSYSTTTWDDPNHSYRAWGNDGTSYNTTLTTTGNTMVGPTIAQAIINLASGLGHIPVFAEFIPPPTDLGACCTPCGCDQLLNEAACLEQDGFFYGIGVSCAEADPPCVIPNTMRINEVRISHDGSPETFEFIELIGDPHQPLCGLSIVNIEGELSSKGQVDWIVSLDDCGGGEPCRLDSNGFFTAGGSGLDVDLTLFFGTNVFENGTQTLLLLRDTQLSFDPPNNDIDANNDGIADIDPQILGTLVDAIGLIDSGYFAAIDPDRVYLGAPVIGPRSTGQVAAGAIRCASAGDSGALHEWVQLTSLLNPPAGCLAPTLGAPNPSPCGADADESGTIDLIDYANFQFCYGASSAECAVFDLNADCIVDGLDLERFLDRLEASGP